MVQVDALSRNPIAPTDYNQTADSVLKIEPEERVMNTQMTDSQILEIQKVLSRTAKTVNEQQSTFYQSTISNSLQLSKFK